MSVLLVNDAQIQHFWFNIEGALLRYEDLDATKGWLRRAKKQLSAEEFAALIGLVMKWAGECRQDSALSRGVVETLAELEPNGAEERRQQLSAAETRLRALRTKELAAETERRRLAEVEAARRLVFEQLEAEQRKKLELLHQAERERYAREEMLRREAAVLRSAEIARERALHAAAITELSRTLATEFLNAEKIYRQDFASLVPKPEFEALKRNAVSMWLRSLPNPEGESRIDPDDEQLDAIGAVHGNIQVIARAGSGKTTTLVTRAHFLMRHCNVPPQEILLLAFNNKAAAEMLRRILRNLTLDRAADTGGGVPRSLKDPAQILAEASRLGIRLPHVMTFHALARGIVMADCHDRGIPAPDIVADREDDQTQSQVLQEVIDDKLQTPAGLAKVRELMLAHFREDWEHIVKGLYDRSPQEFLTLRRSVPHVTLGNEFVKSRGEKLLADFLFEHDVPYKYERSVWAEGINYRPDFTLFLSEYSGVVIEYLGLAGDPDYDQISARKRDFWGSKLGWTLIEVTPDELKPAQIGLFFKLLAEKLASLGFPCRRLSEQEIWERARTRAIDRFTATMRSFVSRCRKRSLSPAGLRSLVAGYRPTSPVERMFHGVAQEIYAEYLERLEATGREDFDGILQRAAGLVESGVSQFRRGAGSGDLAKLRFVCVDEYQDFSELFHRLLSGVRKLNPGAELFCVGDDWQAINGFAGSDPRYFAEFERYVGQGRQLSVTTNYRSASSVVELGNALMRGRGNEAKPAPGAEAGGCYIADLKDFEPSVAEQARHRWDAITPAVLRLVNKAVANGSDVILLGRRRNGLPWFVSAGGAGLEDFLSGLRSHLPKELRHRVDVSTVHKFKGLERSFVILLDAVSRSFPLIHPDWVFARLFGDTIAALVDEERRLFYVALTRAAHTVVFVTDTAEQSVFVADMQRGPKCEPIRWADWPPPSGPSAHVVIKIGNRAGRGNEPTLRIKDQLKACRYRWESSNEWPAWVRSERRDGFSIENVMKEAWCTGATDVEVRVLDEAGAAVSRYIIEKGVWRNASVGT